MLRLVQNIILVILTSTFVFPFEFSFLPNVNTKLILSFFGLLLFLVQSARARTLKLDPGFIEIVLLALLFSLVCFVSVIYNHTTDYAYVTYIISMFVWLFGAYTIVWSINEVYGKVSIPLISNFIIAAAVLQCILALLIEYFPAFSAWVDKIVLGVGFQKSFSDVKGERLYGIGAFLDVGGMRFSCILGILAVIGTTLKNDAKKWIPYIYVACFIIIACIGNMISRTTLVGIAFALFYLFWKCSKGDKQSLRMLKCLTILLLISIPVIIYIYHSNIAFYNKFRFGFEGFFSLAEQGEWQTTSGDKLQTMYVFPDNLKTWLIGDGYFEDVRKDPYYIGYNWLYFYMGTDVGYSRFIFYFGLIGLTCFCLFFIKCCTYLMGLFPKYKIMFLIILFINFIVWFKVASDCFTLFALYLACALFQTETSQKDISNINLTKS